MSYDRETYEKVENRLYEMRLKAADDLEKKKQIFYSRFPRAKEIAKIFGAYVGWNCKSSFEGEETSKEALESLKKESEKLKEELAEIILRARAPEELP